jgi:photosystem II PsbZ protein
LFRRPKLNGSLISLVCLSYRDSLGESYDFAVLGKVKMTIVFQFALVSLVLMSFVLVIGVPVAYATPQNWVESKKLLWVGSGVWIALVLLVGLLNFFVV